MPVTKHLTCNHARLYVSVRTAHLERARQSPPAAIVYQARRYDFDESLTAGLELVQASPLRAAVLLARSPLTVLEINEPLMVASLRTAALAVVAVRLRGLLTRRRVEIVTYAIVNLDPWRAPVAPGLRSRLRRWSDRLLAGFIWRRLDRICFGTEAARQLHAQLMRPTGAAETVVPALPVAIGCDLDRDRLLVVYLGIFLPRKGIDQVLAAWPLVRRAVPGARLAVLGKGALEVEVHAAAAGDASIDVSVDPARSVIRDVLCRAQVLALPSQPTPIWREQVGLPIVEGLAAGCSVVTTTETGLAGWLAAHGHSVIAPGSPPEVLAQAIVDQLLAQRPAADVVADLPGVDGRLEADGWLFGRSSVAGASQSISSAGG